MKDKVLLLIMYVILLSSFVSALEHYYEIELDYDQGKITNNRIQIKPVDKMVPRNVPGGYIAEVMSNNDKLLNLTFFSIPLTIMYDNVDKETGEIVSGGMLELDQVTHAIYIPYFENAKQLNIYDKDVEIVLTIDLQQYSKISITEQEPEKQQTTDTIIDSTQTQSRSEIWYLVIIFSVLIIAILFYIKTKTKANE